MNYIFVISLSGSCMLLLYFCQKHTIGRKLPRRWHYLFLKAAMLYYLIPLPWLGMLYRKIIKDFRGEPDLGYFYFYHNEKVLYQSGDEFAISTGYQHRLLLAGLWFLVAFLVFAAQFIGYIRACRGIRQCEGGETGDEAVLERKRREFHIRRRVTMYACGSESTAFTVGIWKPAIVCFLPDDPLEKELLLAHELVHIKRLDLLWKMAGAAALCLNWFNPFVYLFLGEFEQVCEESCDELAAGGCGEEERYRYAVMLVRRARQQDGMKGWKTPLARKAKRVSERAGLIMEYENKKSRRNGIAAVALGVAMVILNSVTVLAYEEVKVVRGGPEEEVKGGWVQDMDIKFMSSGIKLQDSWKDVILYEEQFVDEEGNIFPVKEKASGYMKCDHAYVEEVYVGHNEDENGGCIIEYFESQRCRNCENYVIGMKVGNASFIKCIH